MTKLQTLAADLSAHARNMILGDFNLAPRESDGPVETILSTFTSACERGAFAKHAQPSSSTLPRAGEAVFTFSRVVAGVPSRFAATSR